MGQISTLQPAEQNQTLRSNRRELGLCPISHFPCPVPDEGF